MAVITITLPPPTEIPTAEHNAITSRQRVGKYSPQVERHRETIWKEQQRMALRPSNAGLHDLEEQLGWAAMIDARFPPPLHEQLAPDIDREYRQLTNELALAAVRQEIRLRKAGFRDLRTPNTEHSEATNRLRDDIAATVYLIDALEGEGYPITFRTKAGAGSAPCPKCGGHDRFVLFPISPQRKSGGWCRQCGHSGDVVAIMGDLWGFGFVDTISRLAERYLLGRSAA